MAAYTLKKTVLGQSKKRAALKAQSSIESESLLIEVSNPE